MEVINLKTEVLLGRAAERLPPLSWMTLTYMLGSDQRIPGRCGFQFPVFPTKLSPPSFDAWLCLPHDWWPKILTAANQGLEPWPQGGETVVVCDTITQSRSMAGRV